MRLERIIEQVYCRPWVITPAKHKAIQTVLEAHLDKAAFLDPSYFKESEDDDCSYEIVGTTAVIPIEGTILNRCSGLEAMCGAFGLQNFKAVLQEVAARDDVKTILLNICSGGGTVTGVPEAADLISKVNSVKPVYAYTDECIASAAYWLASQAKAIFISKSAEIGSIGVYLALLDISAAMEQQGVKLELFKAGKYKAMGLSGNPLSEEEKAMLQAGVDKVYAQFTGYVTAKRPKVSSEAMQGQLFSSEDALRAGLIDGVVNDVNALISYLNQ